MNKIETQNTPAVVGHYSQGIKCNGFVFVSGQVATDPKTREKVIDSIEAQTEQALRNVEAVLVAAGSDLNRVVKLTVYLSGIEHWSAANAAIAKVFGEYKPARAIIPVGEFGDGLKIEIDAIALVETGA